MTPPTDQQDSGLRRAPRPDAVARLKPITGGGTGNVSGTSSGNVPATVRLNKRMAELGMASRREADDWIARGWVKVNGKVAVELSEAGIKALKAFNKAKASEAKAKALKAKAEAILRAELGKAVTATIEGVAVASVVASKNTHFDRELMRDVFPEAFEATLRTTEYTYIKTA
jgi:antitoxin (DNA-binding transcriptional repressor) of toxin-antitoxin stability system